MRTRMRTRVLRAIPELLGMVVLIGLIAMPARTDVNPVGGVPIVGSGGGGGITINGTNNWGGTNTFVDNQLNIVDNGDATKKAQIDASAITTGNTVIGLTFAGTAAAPSVRVPSGTAAIPGLGVGGGTTGLFNPSGTILAFAQASQLRLSFGAVKNLTESNATTVVTLAGGAGVYDTGSIEYGVIATDATDFQARSGKVYWSYENKAGTEICVVTGFDGTANPTELKDSSGTGAISGSTLTYAWAADTTGANQCLLTVNAVSGLTQTLLQFSATAINRGAFTNLVLTP